MVAPGEHSPQAQNQDWVDGEGVADILGEEKYLNSKPESQKTIHDWEKNVKC